MGNLGGDSRSRVFLINLSMLRLKIDDLQQAGGDM